MAARGSTVCESSVDAAPAPSGITEEEEDVYLLYDYDPEAQGQGEECGPTVENAREKLRAKSSGKTSLGSRLLPWRWAHIQCDAKSWSKGALSCRIVKRPFWILVAILYVGYCLTIPVISQTLHATMTLNTDCMQRPRQPFLLCMGQYPLRPR